jgi:GTP-binding protein
MQKFDSIRNIAIIAHVDHGKTTLVDGMLKQTHTFRENEEAFSQTAILDSNDLEREKGITILAKNTSVFYKSPTTKETVKINIIDTPGHADFGGEVERVLNMAEGAILVVDAAEGPLPQTSFVLKLALLYNLKIILVINKIDKKLARPKEVLQETEELFLRLAHYPEHLDFNIVYAVGRDGKAFLELPKNYDSQNKGDLTPLFEEIIKTVPAPKQDTNKPFQMLISTLDYDTYLGKLAIGKIQSGIVHIGQNLSIVTPEKTIDSFKVEKLFGSVGLKREEIESAQAGDIAAIAGKTKLAINQTLCDPQHQIALPAIAISPPTLKITIGPNTSPFSGREGKYVTSRQIYDRLLKEKETNLGLLIAQDENSSKFVVSGRGELHLAVLIENMRREGYEMEVSKPQVIEKNIDGKLHEPFLEVTAEVPSEFIGIITEEFGKRKAALIDMISHQNGLTKFIYRISERNFLGARSILLTATRGTVNVSSLFIDYLPVGEALPKLRNGAIIVYDSGKALAYGLQTVCERGILFIPAGTEVYEGMVVGLNAKEEDMEINVCKGKKLTNMHTENSDEAIVLTPPLIMSLEQSLDFIADDELLEVTPKNLRIRKKFLSHVDRVRAQRAKK